MPFGYRIIARHMVLSILLLLLTIAPASAIMSGDESERAPSSDTDDYAQGKAAFDREDWQGVIDSMTREIEQRPWHDDAYNLMGFAYRRLGDYDRALQAYDRALELNPHHRGALEYLGEAYLELDRPERAKETLDRLEVECRRIATNTANGGWQSGCEEWQELSAAYEAHVGSQDGE